MGKINIKTNKESDSKNHGSLKKGPLHVNKSVSCESKTNGTGPRSPKK